LPTLYCKWNLSELQYRDADDSWLLLWKGNKYVNEKSIASCLTKKDLRLVVRLLWVLKRTTVGYVIIALFALLLNILFLTCSRIWSAFGVWYCLRILLFVCEVLLKIVTNVLCSVHSVLMLCLCLILRIYYYYYYCYYFTICTYWLKSVVNVY